MKLSIRSRFLEENVKKRRGQERRKAIIGEEKMKYGEQRNKNNRTERGISITEVPTTHTHPYTCTRPTYPLPMLSYSWHIPNSSHSISAISNVRECKVPYSDCVITLVQSVILVTVGMFHTVLVPL